MIDLKKLTAGAALFLRGEPLPVFRIFTRLLPVGGKVVVLPRKAKKGQENLKPLSERTKAEQREIQSAGGKASGEARRRKKSMKAAAKLLLNLPADDKHARTLSDLGIDSEDITNQMAVLVAVMKKAQKGDVKAAAFLRDTMGESPAAEIHRADLKQRKEEFAYRQARDAAGDMTELEDMESMEAALYGEDSRANRETDSETPNHPV